LTLALLESTINFKDGVPKKEMKKISKKLNKLLLATPLVSVASLLFIAVPGASAASSTTDTWTGLGVNDNWSTLANWSNGIPVNGDSLVFSLNSNTPVTKLPASATGGTASFGYELNSNNDLTGLQLNSLTFNSDGHPANGGAYVTISGNSFSLSGGIDDEYGQYGELALDNSINLTADQTFNFGLDQAQLGSNSSGSVASVININSYDLTISGGGQDLNIQSNIKGSGKLIFSNSVAYIFSSNSSYTGISQIIDGSHLYMDSQEALGSGAIVVSTSTLEPNWDYKHSGQGSLTFANPLFLSGSGIPATTGTSSVDSQNGAVFVDAGNLKLTGLITLRGDTTLGGIAYGSPGVNKDSYTMTQPVQAEGYSLKVAPSPDNAVQLSYKEAVIASPKPVNTGISSKTIIIIAVVVLIVLLLFVWLIIRKIRGDRSKQAPLPPAPQQLTVNDPNNPNLNPPIPPLTQ
jgi:hypothetical protein